MTNLDFPICDFHTHILCKIDDGAKDICESIELLKEESAQGVKKVCLTPHFYAKNDSYEEFLLKRNQAYEVLLDGAADLSERPDFYLGAETYYYRGISDSDRLYDLKLSGTDTILFEMPFRRWTDYEISEMSDIISRKDVKVLFAHFERYLDFNDFSVFEGFLKDGAVFQANASFFDGIFKKKKALEYLLDGIIGAIGSDAHNMDKRPVNILNAYTAIENKMGPDYVKGFIKYQEETLL